MVSFVYRRLSHRSQRPRSFRSCSSLTGHLSKMSTLRVLRKDCFSCCRPKELWSLGGACSRRVSLFLFLIKRFRAHSKLSHQVKVSAWNPYDFERISMGWWFLRLTFNCYWLPRDKTQKVLTRDIETVTFVAKIVLRLIFFTAYG